MATATMQLDSSLALPTLPRSMADTLPSLNTLNLGFDDLRTRMAAFTARFDEFIERGRQRVLDERNQFRLQVAQTQEQQATHLRTLAALTARNAQHTHAVAQQAAETTEMQTAIASLTATRDVRAEHLSSLQTRLAAANKAVSSRKAAQRAHAAEMAQQDAQNAVELAFWERGLGLRIEGTGREDRVRFVFGGCDVKRREREVWFELDMSGVYEVVECRPGLEEDKVRKVTERMSEGEDLRGFLGGMRRLFCEEFKR